MKELDLEEVFAAGARSVASEHGMSEKDAEALVYRLCKEARPRVRIVDDDDDGDTWWSRNKGWALPTGIGIGAFLLGADAGRNGRPDRSYLSNAGSLLWERVQALLGIPNSSLWRSLTQADPEKMLNRDSGESNVTEPSGTAPGPYGAYPKGSD